METETINTSSISSFLQEAEAFHEIFGNQIQSLNKTKTEALEVFRTQGIPNTKHEEWKYVNFSFLSKQTYKTPGPHAETMLSAEDVQQFKLSENCLLFVIENGTLNINASNGDALPKGIKVGSIATLIDDPRVQQHLFKHADFNEESFVALNTVLMNDGIVIIADKNAKIETDIHVAVISNVMNEVLSVPVRILVIAEEGAELSVIESYHTVGNQNSVFVNAVSEVVIGENAHLKYIKLQNENANSSHVNYHKVNMAKNSYQHITTITLGGSLVRNNLNIRLDDVNCSSYLNGLYIADGQQLFDNHTLVDHAMPNCYSNELYKGIIGGSATGVFNGKIFVRKDAQKTNAYQSNKNILLSDNASMNAKPQLEIFADDVKCSHGATTGQIDEEALFYLRARGIGEDSARALLNHAFAADVIEQIPDELVKEKLLGIISEKLNTIKN